MEDVMKFELLPNEILLDLFEYFDGTDLLRAFYHLNTRFNFLLYKQYQSYCFRFRPLSKRDFDMICQQHLPNITERVIALDLTDYVDIPRTTNLFFSYVTTFRQFTHLRSITLHQLPSYEMLLKILDECQHLCHFTHLTIFCSFSSNEADLQLIINKIWSLPRLTYCYNIIEIDEQNIFCTPTIISTSIECITIFSDLKLNQINQIFDYTPHLKYLSINVTDTTDYDDQLYPFLTLIRLNIPFFCLNIPKMILFFQNMPNLRHLDISIQSELIDGRQWEYIIHNYLPKLKIFKLKMEKFYYFDQNIHEEANRLLDSFRSSFWINEHQWFIRCFIQRRTIHLYTSSTQSSFYNSTHPSSWKSTCSHENQQDFYNNVTRIYDKTFFDQPIPSDIHLPNIHYLRMTLPVSDQFWLIVPNLHRLESLVVIYNVDAFQSQLQTLLDRAPKLHSLSIQQNESLPLHMSLFKYTSVSVRSLDLEDYQHYFNEEECLLLSRSPLAVKCENLSIWITNGKNIMHFVRNMTKLRSLIVICENDEYCRRPRLMKDKYTFVKWLKARLPSTYMIVRGLKPRILIWM